MNNPCDNGLACDGLETCTHDGGEITCTDGTPLSCDFPTFCTEPDGACVDPCDGADCTDGNDCTTDTCTTNEDGTTTCDNDRACDDADACTEGDTCDDDGECAGTPIECPAGEVCADGVCVCADDTACDDGDACTGTETCDVETGECVAGTPFDCDDGLFCTGAATCETNSETGEPDCVDGPDPCPEGETCDEESGLCLRPCTIDADCDDTDPCTDGFCGEDGFCDATDVDCDDGDDCTLNSCDPATGACLADPLCDDGDLCTTDNCTAGVCDFVPTACDQGFTCNPANGLCEDTVCPFDAECDDGFFCNGPEICNPADPDADADGCVSTGNPCSGTTPICLEDEEQCVACVDDADCDDGFACTEDICEVDGSCTNTPVDASCDDGLFCTGTETCDPADGDAGADGCVDTDDPCGGETPNCNETTDECEGSSTNVEVGLSETSISFDHEVNVTECPQTFGSFLVTNTGTVETMYTISVGNAPLTTDSPSFTLAPGENKVVGVTFTCAQAVSFTGTITVTGEAAGQMASATLEVTGNIE